MTDHIRIELDDRIFVAPFFTEVTISGWRVTDGDVVVPGSYEIRPWTNDERRQHRRELRRWARDRRRGRPALHTEAPKPYRVAVTNNSVSMRIRAVVIEDGKPPKTIAHYGHS